MKTRLSLIVLAFLATTNAPRSQGQGWVNFGQMPVPVSGGEAIVHGDAIFVLGGFFDLQGRTLDLIQKYQPSVPSWQTVGTMGSARQNFVASLAGDSAYYFGGVSMLPAATDSAIEVVNLLQPSGGSFYDTNTTFARSMAAGLVKNGKFYIFGGVRRYFPEQSYLVEYDLPSRAITFRMDTSLFGSLGYGQMAASIGEDVFLFGGVRTVPTAEIYKFNTMTHAFQTLPVSLRDTRAFGRAVRLGDSNKIMILGGREEQPLRSTLWRYSRYNPGQRTSFHRENHSFSHGKIAWQCM